MTQIERYLVGRALIIAQPMPDQYSDSESDWQDGATLAAEWLEWVLDDLPRDAQRLDRWHWRQQQQRRQNNKAYRLGKSR